MDPNDVNFNPWSTDGSTTGLRNALLLAQRTGHICKTNETDVSWTRHIDEMPSMKMIALQKEISQYNERLYEVNSEIQKRQLYHETKDITDIRIMEQRTKQMKDLSDHLQLVVTNKEALVNRLQQPFVGDYIKLEATFHKYASELFSMLAPILSDLTSHLDNLQWVNNKSFPQSQLDDMLVQLSGAIASVQTNVTSITNMSHSIQNYQSLNASHITDVTLTH